MCPCNRQLWPITRVLLRLLVSHNTWASSIAHSIWLPSPFHLTMSPLPGGVAGARCCRLPPAHHLTLPDHLVCPPPFAKCRGSRKRNPVMALASRSSSSVSAVLRCTSWQGGWRLRARRAPMGLYKAQAGWWGVMPAVGPTGQAAGLHQGRRRRRHSCPTYIARTFAGTQLSSVPPNTFIPTGFQARLLEQKGHVCSNRFLAEDTTKSSQLDNTVLDPAKKYPEKQQWRTLESVVGMQEPLASRASGRASNRP